MSTGSFPERTKALIRTRSGGICEGCKQAPATEFHHRKYKSRGGAHDPQNGLHLCGGPGGMFGGNHTGCHGIAHTKEGHDLGWSVNSWGNPLTRAVVDRAGTWSLLLPDGTRHELAERPY